MSEPREESFRSLDEFLELPFERIETELQPTLIERLEIMEQRLQELDDELSAFLEDASCPVQ